MSSTSPDSGISHDGLKARKIDVNSKVTSAYSSLISLRVKEGLAGRHSVDEQKTYIPHSESSQQVVRAEQPAIMMTNERLSASMLKEWGEQHHPDGYIVAVGCGASLFLPYLFSEANPPRGIALIDLDDRVVAMSQAFVNALRRCQTYEEYYDQFFYDPVQAASNFLSGKQTKIFGSMNHEEQIQLQSGIRSVRLNSTSETNGQGRPNFFLAMRELFPIWKSLADAGKIQVLHASVTDPHVRDTLLAQWLDYSDHTNVVYDSNVLDHLVEVAYPETISPNNSLHESFWISNLDKVWPAQVAALNQWDGGSKRTLFMHTLRSFNYSLRLELGGIQDVHPLDLACSKKMRDVLTLLTNLGLPDHHYDDAQMRAQPEDKLKYLVELYSQTTTWSKELIIYIAEQLSVYVGMYNITRENEGKVADGFEWLERRFGLVAVELVRAYRDSSHPRVVHA